MCSAHTSPYLHAYSNVGQLGLPPEAGQLALGAKNAHSVFGGAPALGLVLHAARALQGQASSSSCHILRRASSHAADPVPQHDPSWLPDVLCFTDRASLGLVPCSCTPSISVAHLKSVLRVLVSPPPAPSFQDALPPELRWL
eukprot:1005065-Pelagomonas_calceolata.AAC.1